MNHIISSANRQFIQKQLVHVGMLPTCLMHWSSWLPLVLYLHVLLLTSSMAADISCTFIICVPFYIQFMFFPLRQFSSKLSLLSRFHYSLRRRVKLVFRASLHWTRYNVDICSNCVISNAKRHWTQAVFWGWNARIQKEISKYYELLGFCYGVTMIFSLC